MALPQRELGKSGIKVSADRARLHVVFRRLRPVRRCRRHRADPRRARPRHHVPRFVGCLRQGPQRDAARQRAEGPARRRGDRHQVRQSRRRRRQVRRRPAGVRHQLLRGEPEAARHRRHRSLLPAPHRPDRADRGHGRRHGEAGRAGQGAGAGPERSRAQDHPPRPQGASDRGGAERILAALPRAGRRHAARPRASSASRSSPMRRSAAACSPPTSPIRRRWPTATPASASRAMPATTSPTTGRWRRRSRRSRSARAARRRSSRSPGCWRRART